MNYLNPFSCKKEQCSSIRSIPILLTSSIVPHDKSVKLVNPEDRLRHAIESVGNWLKINPSIKLVLCDGSNFDLSKEIKKQFHYTEIEFLRFENDEKLVSKFGRGYGEGEIIKHALMNSKFIKNAGAFAKCSSKLWVQNYNQCLSYWNGYFLCKGVFLNVFSPFKKMKMLHIDTRFFIANNEYYEKHFLNAHHNINVADGHGLEECFLEVIKLEQLKGILLPVHAQIQGVGGGTASYYKNSLKRNLKEKLRIQMIKHKKEFADLFAIKDPIRTDA